MENHTLNIGYQREWERRRELQQAGMPLLLESGSVEVDGPAEIIASDTKPLSYG